MSEPKMTATVLGMVPTVAPTDPEQQAEDLLHRILLPLADTLRGQGSGLPTTQQWHPGAIYLALLRCGVIVMGTEWVAEEDGKAKLLRGFDELIPILREEAGESFDWALKAYVEAEAKKAETATKN